MKRATWIVLSSLCLAPVAAAAESTSATPTPDADGPLAIVVYDQPNFQGRTMTFTQAVPDLATLKFDDKIASLAITGAGDWVLCEHKNYKGRCARVQGKAQNLKLFDVVGRVSSLYPVPATPATTAP